MTEKVSSFTGTPYEILAWLDSYYNAMRVMANISKESSDDKEFWDIVLKNLDLSVYRITVEPMGAVTSDWARPNYVMRATRIKTALELYDILTGQKLDANASYDGDDTVTT